MHLCHVSLGKVHFLYTALAYKWCSNVRHPKVPECPPYIDMVWPTIAIPLNLWQPLLLCFISVLWINITYLYCLLHCSCFVIFQSQVIFQGKISIMICIKKHLLNATFIIKYFNLAGYHSWLWYFSGRGRLTDCPGRVWPPSWNYQTASGRHQQHTR